MFQRVNQVSKSHRNYQINEENQINCLKIKTNMKRERDKTDKTIGSSITKQNNTTSITELPCFTTLDSKLCFKFLTFNVWRTIREGPRELIRRSDGLMEAGRGEIGYNYFLLLVK